MILFFFFISANTIAQIDGGGYGFKIPIGFTFRPINNEDNLWEVGFASLDLTTWFRTNDPLVSIVFGFLRFGF